MATANEQLRDALVRHQIYVARVSGSIRNRVTELLGDTEQELAERIRGRLSTTGLTSQADIRRLESVNEAVAKIRGEAWDKSAALLKEETTALAVAEASSVAQTITAVSPVVLDVTTPAPSLLRSIVTSRPFEGRLLSEWAAKMRDDDIRRIQNQIRVGMVAGDPGPVIARRIVGTARANGSDGILQMTRRQVENIVRTAVMHVSSEARREFAMTNRDIISKEIWAATLDSRVCLICAPLDGKLFDIGKGPEPPQHIGCRCVRVPAIDPEFGAERPQKPVTERMLVREYARENDLGDISTRDRLPRGTKGKFDAFARRRTRELVGPIPAKTSYAEWLRSQSAEFQDDVLGVTKGKLFREGGLSLEKFTHRNGDELTIAELATREKSAFRAAGIEL